MINNVFNEAYCKVFLDNTWKEFFLEYAFYVFIVPRKHHVRSINILVPSEYFC